MRHQLAIDAIERSPEIRAGEIHGRRYDVGQFRVRSGKDNFEVGDDLARLFDDILAYSGSGFEVARDLPRYV